MNITVEEFIKREMHIWGEDYIFDLIDRGYVVVLTDRGYKWLLASQSKQSYLAEPLDTAVSVC